MKQPACHLQTFQPQVFGGCSDRTDSSAISKAWGKIRFSPAKGWGSGQNDENPAKVKTSRHPQQLKGFTSLHSYLVFRHTAPFLQMSRFCSKKKKKHADLAVSQEWWVSPNWNLIGFLSFIYSINRWFWWGSLDHPHARAATVSRWWHGGVLNKSLNFRGFEAPSIRSGVKIRRENEKGVKTKTWMPGRNNKTGYEIGRKWWALDMDEG